MNYVLWALILGAVIAFAVQGLKLFGVPLEGKQRIIRLVVAVAALCAAYRTLSGQPGLAVQDVLVYAAGIVAAAEGVYKWLIQQVTKKGVTK